MTQQHSDLLAGLTTFRCRLNPNHLLPGLYSLGLGLVDEKWNLLGLLERALLFTVTDVPEGPEVLSPRRPGKLLLSYPWERISE